jgi:hypothetical protein
MVPCAGRYERSVVRSCDMIRNQGCLRKWVRSTQTHNGDAPTVARFWCPVSHAGVLR